MTWRVGALLAVTIACVVVALSGPRVPQSIQYFDFADERTLAGIPNAFNVLSNVAFLAVGVAGLAVVRPGRAAFRDPRERTPWRVLFAGVTLTGVGSAWFHLAPSSASLVWDRLPMTIGFMGLLSALLTERVDARWGRRLLWPLVALGLGSVLYWYFTELAGAGDLR
ncbi:MAG TPA: ceramidase domain-containing protein, partial [Anaeromyxobacteraceae bacterium]|nr:ceramidase domain-containing protein [Anaeromyxobacteraceae bacterium]